MDSYLFRVFRDLFRWAEPKSCAGGAICALNNNKNNIFSGGKICEHLNNFYDLSIVMADLEVVIDYVAIFYGEWKGGEDYRKKNKFCCQISTTEKSISKLKNTVW